MKIYRIFQAKLIPDNDLIELENITNDVIRNLAKKTKLCGRQRNVKRNEVYLDLKLSF